MGWRLGARFPAETRDFSVLHSIQTDSEHHLASYLIGTRGSFPGGKVAKA
jgi:hypothetical protein